MGERPTKRLRRLSTEEDDTLANDWIPEGINLNGRKGPQQEQTRAEPPTAESTMPRAPRRGVAIPTTATVKHSPPTANNPGHRSIRLTVKAPPSKLREVISGSQLEDPAPPPTRVSTARQALSRNSKNRKPIVETSSDEDGDDDADEDVEMADAVNGDEDEEDEDDEEEPGATISVAPKPPTLRITAPAAQPSPGRILKLSPKVESVEHKEARKDPGNSEEELSDVGSDDELEEENDEEMEEDDEEEDEEEEADDDEDGDAASSSSASDSELPPLSAIQAAAQKLPGQNDNDDEASDRDGEIDDLSSDEEISTSRAETPDPLRMTRRQRGGSPAALIALSNEAQKKKHFTADEITTRRAEMARRRKDLSAKRNEEEKADTLKRLLEKPSGPKRRSRAQVLADLVREEFGLDRGGIGTPRPGEDGVEIEVPKAKPGWVRVVMRADQTRVGVPEEWFGKPVGRVFEGLGSGEMLEADGMGRKDWKVVGGNRLVQVVE